MVKNTRMRIYLLLILLWLKVYHLSLPLQPTHKWITTTTPNPIISTTISSISSNSSNISSPRSHSPLNPNSRICRLLPTSPFSNPVVTQQTWPHPPIRTSGRPTKTVTICRTPASIYPRRHSPIPHQSSISSPSPSPKIRRALTTTTLVTCSFANLRALPNSLSKWTTLWWAITSAPCNRCLRTATTTGMAEMCTTCRVCNSCNRCSRCKTILLQAKLSSRTCRISTRKITWRSNICKEITLSQALTMPHCPKCKINTKSNGANQAIIKPNP